MGTDKNIKLHIVTDIKVIKVISTWNYWEILGITWNYFKRLTLHILLKMGGGEGLTAEQLARTGFLKHFNSDTNNGRRNFVLLTIAGYAGIFAAYKTVKWLKAKPVEEKS